MTEVTMTPETLDRHTPSLAETISTTTSALRLEQNAPQRVIEFERGVRSFLSSFSQLSPPALQERVAFAQSNRDFPVVAEWRFDFGIDRSSTLESELGGLAAHYTGNRPNFAQRLIQMGREQTPIHLRTLKDASPAVSQLNEEVTKLGLDLVMQTGDLYTCVTPAKALRLLVVLKGTEAVQDPREFHLMGELYDNPSVLGKVRLD